MQEELNDFLQNVLEFAGSKRPTFMGSPVMNVHIATQRPPGVIVTLRLGISETDVLLYAKSIVHAEPQPDLKVVK